MIRVGTDIEEIARVARSMKNPRFLTRVFSPAELALFERRNLSAATVAGNFCAKEAFSKALGTGISGFSLNEISVLRAQSGAPYLELSGNARALAERLGLSFSVSISHCRSCATAVVVGYREEGACEQDIG